MGDVATLQQRLRKLSGLHDTVGRPLVAGGRVLCARDVCASLVAEISETQLARYLTFINERSETFACVANGGRVLSIRLADTKTCDLPRAPSDLDPQDISAIAGHLRMFARDIHHLEVRSERVDQAAQSRHGGLSAQTFFDLLATVEGPAAEQISPLVTFTEQCGGLVDALVVLEDGEFPIAQGEPVLVDALKAQAMAEQLPEDPVRGNGAEMSGALGCMIYSGHPMQGRSVFCATQSGALVLSAFQYAKLEAVISLWQKCLRG